jgi:hypothetical protein
LFISLREDLVLEGRKVILGEVLCNQDGLVIPILVKERMDTVGGRFKERRYSEGNITER